jgi:hypothetical protein
VLLARHRDGELDPVPVPLDFDRIPKHHHALRALAEAIALWMGLQLATFDWSDVPLSGRFVARHMGWSAKGTPDGRRGWGGLTALERLGVLDQGQPRTDLQSHGRACRTWRPPEPLASELGFTPLVEGGLPDVEPEENVA